MFKGDDNSNFCQYYEYQINSELTLNLNLYDETLKNPNVTNGIYYIRVKNGNEIFHIMNLNFVLTVVLNEFNTRFCHECGASSGVTNH